MLARFTVLEDVYLGHAATTEGNLGNVKEVEKMSNTRDYYANGNVKGYIRRYSYGRYLDNTWKDHSSGSNDLGSSLFDFFRVYTEGDWEYDESGRVTAIKEYKNGAVITLYQVSYNANGTIDKVTKKENTKQTEYLFTYAEEGRKITVTDFNRVIEYVYNEDGTLAKEELKEYTRYQNETMEEADLSKLGRMEYTYDANGKLVSGIYTYQTFNSAGNRRYMASETVDNHAYVVDSEGCVTQTVVTPGDTTQYTSKGETSTKTAELEKITYDLFYGEFYVYEAAK